MTRLTALKRFARSLGRDRAGSTVIETAFVAPVLVTMALGGYDVSRMIARQHELQSAAADTEAIVLAAASGTATDNNTVKNVLMNTLGLSSSQVSVTQVYRCGSVTTVVTDSSLCSIGVAVVTYVKVVFTDTYTPVWTKFGIGSPFNYRVERTVQVSQATKTS